MTATSKAPVLVVVQLTGGNDFMNTLIPYTNGIYHDSRPVVGIQAEEVLPTNDTLGWNPHAAPLKEMFDAGDVAVVQGIGYPIQTARISGGWTFGIRANLKKSATKAGWAESCEN